MGKKTVFDRVIEAAVQHEGSRTAVAKKLGLTRQALDQWGGKVPAKHVLAMEKMSGIERYEIRPDIYGPKPRPLERAEQRPAA
jgi:DNA-binding transcriptional regulator YdaS (Cro superfamily)